jgi:large subunit ribosomal protein L23
MNILVKPVITEKSMQKAAADTFTFVVARTAHKKDIKKAVEEKFNVNVVHVETSVLKGRTKRVGLRRTEKKLSSWKKAAVTVKKGQKIALFDIAA